MKYRAYANILGSKYIGEYEANSPEEALREAEQDADVSLCHQCSGEIDDPQIDEVFIEEVI